MHLLVQAEETEAIMDQFEQQYANAKGFYVILFPVEGVLRRPKPDPVEANEAANVICINLAGVATFLAQGVGPRSWWEAERAKKATWRAILVWVVLLAILSLILWLNQ